MKKWTLQSIPFWEEESQGPFFPWISYFPVSFTSWSPLSALLSSLIPTSLKSEAATAKRNPSLLPQLSLLRFLFQGAGAQVWGEGDVNWGCSLGRSVFPQPSTTAKVNPSRAWTAGEDFLSYLIIRLLAIKHDKAARPWDKNTTLTASIPLSNRAMSIFCYLLDQFAQPQFLRRISNRQAAHTIDKIVWKL